MVAPVWTAEHADKLDELVRTTAMTTMELSAAMSAHFKHRISSAQVSALLTRMRKSTDSLYRNTPYRTHSRR